MKFKWLVNNSVIECDEFDNRELIIVLKNGKIHHTDGTTSIFDNLVLPSNEVDPIVKDQKIQRRRKQGGGNNI
jgi:hypothetical protein